MDNNKLFANPEQEAEFERFRKMKQNEREAFIENKQAEFNGMSEDKQAEYIKELNKNFENVLKYAKEEYEKLALYSQLGDISRYVSLAQISSDYFGKTKQWLYQRIKGYTINGKPAKFTDEEKEKFRSALLDVSNKIKDTALNI